MTTVLRLTLFSLRQLSAMGYWQAGAEMCGGDTRRAHADAHRHLHDETAAMLREALHLSPARQSRL